MVQPAIIERRDAISKTPILERIAAMRETLMAAGDEAQHLRHLPAWASKAAAVLPTTNMAEEEGTYTNLRGRVQRYLQAKAAPGAARPTFAVLSDLLIAEGEKAEYWLASDV